jgi:curved DNA-binding protein CbpA
LRNLWHGYVHGDLIERAPKECEIGMPPRDPYELLGVSREASETDVRKAYRRLASKHHPDANPDDPQAEERFKEIQQAYEILSDPEKRRKHDERFRASYRRSRGGLRTQAGGRPGSSNTFQVDLADLLARSGDSARGGELRDENIARAAKLFGLGSISKLLGKAVTIRAQATLGSERPNAPNKHGPGERPPGVNYEKPPIPRKPPKPPKTGGP